jgi:arginine utilization protein RocB
MRFFASHYYPQKNFQQKMIKDNQIDDEILIQNILIKAIANSKKPDNFIIQPAFSLLKDIRYLNLLIEIHVIEKKAEIVHY